MSRVGRSGRHPQAFVPFFLAAAGFAAGSVSWWALAWTGMLPASPGDAAAHHAHEMLLGYALAVVAGFLFTKVSRPALAFSLALWLAGRLPLEPGWAAAAVALAFPAAVATFAALPFLRAARNAHNLVFAPALAAFIAAELLYQLGRLDLVAGGERRGAMLALDLVTLLLVMMGGRVIPAATAGIVREKGGFLAQRVQPWLEWTGIAGVAAAALSDTLQILPGLGGAGCAAAGAAVLARLARWRTAWTLDAPAIWSLHLGYAWLGLGLLGRGTALTLGWPPPADAAHAVTVGALGTLTVAMMMRTVLQRRGLPVRFCHVATAAVALVSLAAASRLSAPLSPLLTLVAAAVWTAAMTAVGIAILKALGRSRVPPTVAGPRLSE